MRTNQNEFFASATAGKTFKEVLTEVQEYLSEKYSNLLIDNEGDGKEQIKRYIRQYLIAAHMAYAGVKQDLFTSGAEDEIFKVSAGIPRMINRICEKTLMYAYQQQKRLIDEHMVRFVADHEMVSGIE